MKKRKYLTGHEIDKLLNISLSGVCGTRDYCLIYLAFTHGLRVSELCSLRLSDIDLEARTIYIYRLKNGFSTVHPLRDKEVVMLRKWLAIRERINISGSDFLFISMKGGGISRKRVYSLMATLGEQADISVRVHPHMLRHSCGFALADLGIDTRLIQDYLGHRNIQHTVTYTASNSARFLNIWKD
ncbi:MULTISPECIES: tyrosine-type DNA invertase [Serratia]|uniref:tyrosine-type DNA invertase n=1 Tax=Serratia TaxID=613 RepID=UPI0018D64F92|nr:MULTISPECIES: tyrosine-type DNA invertase [Serratia]MBH2988207.1 tyrosine-type recombinase/integrase [Serratia ureilytica]MBL0903945.1 tyrosine-type recombinase/integrase [Serratia bockelmannii]